MPPSEPTELANVLGAYMRELTQQGFRREEALHIVISYQETILFSKTQGSESGATTHAA